MSTNLRPVLGHLAAGGTLDADAAEAAFAIIMSGEATPAQIGGLLMAMRVRGETVPELIGAVRAARARMLTIEAPEGAIDVCGTGGDGAGTLNVSTAVTFVLAGLGVPVAKHGNRALSSQTGGADVLTAIGVGIEPPIERLSAILRAAGCVFLFAPRHHAALRHAAGPRVELGTRTIFNLLGPMANPAGVRRQLTGVFDAAWARPMAETLRSLGTTDCWIVHGMGLDELTTAGESQVVALDHGELRAFMVTPEHAGLSRSPLNAIKGGNAAANAAALLALLDGARSAYRDTVVLNAAAGLIVAGRVETLKDGAILAAGAIDDGSARAAPGGSAERDEMTGIAVVDDVLARICDETRAETARRKAKLGLEAIRAKALGARPTRGFGPTLMLAASRGIGLIAEIKKASPSSGLIRADFDPAALAHSYEEAGAACLSVLTDGPYFQGSIDHLKAARAAVALPVLRKDFILEPWQVYESRLIGADCILLIMAALTDDRAIELETIARGLDLDVLVEVHDRQELDRALGLQTKLVGINNRNLKTLETDLATTEELSSHVPPDRFLIAESGIRTHADILRLKRISVHCVLVGESLMRQPDVAAATRELLGQ